jgi:hypothetical protein
VNIEARIAAAFAQPLTHRVSTVYASGVVKTHDVRGLGAANNWAIGERRKIGRKLINRVTGETVEVVDVTIDAL